MYSLEFPLGSEPVLELRADRTADVCAVRDAEKLRVYQRERWKDVRGSWTISRLVRLALDGHYEQLELVANELRKMPRTRVEYGESFYANLVERLGECWAEIDLALAAAKQPESSSSPAELDDMRNFQLALEHWKATGSEMALVASAFRHYEIGYKARGTGYASDVTQAGWNEFGRRIELAKAEVGPLLRSQAPSCAALRIGMLVGLHSGNSVSDLQALHKRFLENYPYDTQLHTSLCIHLLPRWGGSSGEAGAYLNSVADLLPQPHADILYVRTALNFYRVYNSLTFNSGEGGLSSSRVMRSIGTMMERNELNARDAETFIAFSLQVRRSDLAEKVAQYHVQRFPLSRFKLNSPELATLRSVRQAMDSE